MSKMRFIGDVHGKFGPYKTILKNSPYPTIQVGDMGVGFKRWPHGEFEQNPPFDLMVEKEAYFIRGNHDNPGACSKHRQFIKDGTIQDNMMFVGGAVSIDKAYRIEGYSWWENEELSTHELNTLVDVFVSYKPEIMITHECPESVAEQVLGVLKDLRTGSPMKLDPRFASITRQAFQSMFELHQPKLWIFGHWHVPFDKKINGTRFVCLPELAYMDVDTENLECGQDGNAAVC